MKLSEIKSDDFLKVLQTGEPSVGKSSAMITYPRPIFVFDFEQRMRSVIPYANKLGIPLSEIEVETFTDWNSAIQKLRGWRTNCPFKSIGFDSFTSMADTILAQVINIKGMEKGSQTKRIGNIQVSSIEDYMAESGAFGEWIQLMRQVPAHVIANAHLILTEVQDAGTKKVTIQRSLLTGGKKIAAKIPAYVDYVFNFSLRPNVDASKPPERLVYTQSNGVDFAKSSTTLPFIIEWTNKNFYEELKKHWGKETE